jgi:dipeptidyl aminopeptidase/acylaminoacyl peptidase
MYDISQLCVTELSTGKASILSAKIDRSFSTIHWSPDSRKLYSLYEDDRNQNIVSFDIASGEMNKVTDVTGVYSSVNMNTSGDMVCLFSSVYVPNEVFLLESGIPTKITSIQDGFLSKTKLAFVKGFQSVSADGTRVSNILYLPDSSARNLPLILFIHGGPVAQDEFDFDLSRQILASAGFAVAAVNYRGSSGRGYAYAKAIYADWGNKEVMDIIGAANHLIKSGIVDSSRMGIGGWSYGGILTNYTIATDTRFKAAVSGAGSSFQFTMYGTDQYVKQYDDELGPPWRNFQKWVQLSYPYLKVQKIKTPTLFMASEDDFNVPVAGAEQMYQAFKYEGIPTELTIYPGQNHGVSVPSYIVHRYRRHIDWFKKFLK